MRLLPIFLLGFAIIVAGCATIIQGTSQSISVNSNPSGAKIIVMGMERGTTPAVIKVDRSDSNIIVRIVKDGYEPVEVMLTRSVSGWIFGNIVFGGLLGLVVDFATGGAYNVSPEFIQANLQSIHTMNLEKDYPKGFLVIELVDIN